MSRQMKTTAKFRLKNESDENIVLVPWPSMLLNTAVITYKKPKLCVVVNNICRFIAA
jgi:hypothetical protein